MALTSTDKSKAYEVFFIFFNFKKISWSEFLNNSVIHPIFTS